MASVRLLGPDLATPLVISDVPVTATITEVKERALESWPAGEDAVSLYARGLDK